MYRYSGKSCGSAVITNGINFSAQGCAMKKNSKYNGKEDENNQLKRNPGISDIPLSKKGKGRRILRKSLIAQNNVGNPSIQ